MTNPNFLFLDIETTGLDPASDDILEIAWVLTDSNFNTFYEPQTFLVKSDDWASTFTKLFDRQVVREMHQASGLTNDLIMQGVKALGEIFTTLYAELLTTPEDEKIHLAGSSVHFDKSFLLANGWGTIFEGDDALINHRILDLSALRLMFASAGVPIEEAENKGAHRAVNDVMHDVEQARIFRRTLGALAVKDKI